MKVEIFDSLDGVAARSLELLGGPRVAVSGGTTFAALFRHWAPDVKRRAASGERLRFFVVDERKVPFDDPQCNWKACTEELLVPAGLGDQKSHYVTTAADYTALLDREFGTDPVVFDQVYLGMGEDGHTASLFPGKPTLEDLTSTVLDVTDSPKPPPERVTLGLGPIRASRTLITVVLGAGKVDMVRRLRDHDVSLPITRAMQGHPNAILLLDRAAAGQA
ncbi:MAG TPA: 6-phosphogluconolactonase [Fibrobacteria bacterium]|jgi:6-phosphogluconolactonase|nr:6-phosphogluconolactonase [Fibrobacteria bacterium]